MTPLTIPYGSVSLLRAPTFALPLTGCVGVGVSLRLLQPFLHNVELTREKCHPRVIGYQLEQCLM